MIQVLFRVKQLFVAAQTLALCTVTTQTPPARDDAAEPEDELVPLSVSLYTRKKGHQSQLS